MKYISKQVEIEAEEIVEVIAIEKNKYNVITEACRSYVTVTENPVSPGDFMNVTNPDDIYHTPKSFFSGSGAKYIKVGNV